MTRALRRGVAIGCMLIFGWVASPVAFATPIPGEVPATAPSDPSVAPSTPESNRLSNPEFSLLISPARMAIGQQDTGTTKNFEVVNRGSAPAAVTVQKRDFTSAVDGSLTFQDQAPFSASAWISLEPESFVLAPGARQAVAMSVTMPTDAEPGDHQVGLVFMVPAGDSADGKINVKINRGIGAPVYITAPGPIDDSVSLDALSAAGFATDGPVTLTASITSTGTVHRDFRGDAPLLVDTLGTVAPFADFTVIRGATREISTTWDPPLICVCHPTVSIVNADGAIQTVSVQVIVFPLKLAGIVVGAVLAGWFLILLARRRYKASVIKAAALMNRRPETGNV